MISKTMTLATHALLCFALSAQVNAQFIFGTPQRVSGAPDAETFSIDGTEAYFTRSGRGSGAEDIWFAKRTSINEPFGRAENVGAVVNSDREDAAPSLSSDGLSLYFMSRRRDGLGDNDLYVSTRISKDDSWEPPVNLGDTINSPRGDAHPSISADGLELYFSGHIFSSVRDGGFGGSDLWVTRRDSVAEPFGVAVNLGEVVNTRGYDAEPSISSDGLALFFGSDRPGGRGSHDIWVTTRKTRSDPWGPPVNLGARVNGSAPEIVPHVAPDGSALYFLYSGGGTLWEAPILPFEAVSLSGAGDTYHQDFDEALGIDGTSTGVMLPTGWTSTDNGIIFEDKTTKSFPAGSSVGPRTPIYNAGEDQHPDRALAMGVTDRSDRSVLQLLADVTEHDASSVQLKFDLEVWDAAKRNVELLGEAALDVTMEIDMGDGFAELLNFGTVSTGAKFFPPAGEYLNGNADSNRERYDSTPTNVEIPAGSTLRIRWAPNLDAQSTGWVYGLDNVDLTVFGDVTAVPLQAGDADQDLDVDQLVLVQVQIAAKYLTRQPATWGEGD